MNVVKEIQRINQRELDMGGNGTQGSWHDEYKDSAYIFVGGLPDGITEGDLITICSQYGEVVDVNMPRDKDTGKTKGFGFVMYEDQRSTVLAVDNLSGGTVVDRTIRVDHVKNYKQPKVTTDEGERVDREEQSLNAMPLLVRDDMSEDEGTVSSAPSIDPEDPMRDYLLAKRKEEKAASKSKSTSKSKGDKGKGKKRKHEDETPEERRARKDMKRRKKAASLGALGGEPRRIERGESERERDRRRSPSPRSSRRDEGGLGRDRHPERERERNRDRHDDRRPSNSGRPRSKSPPTRARDLDDRMHPDRRR